jgi:transposase-like protein
MRRNAGVFPTLRGGEAAAICEITVLINFRGGLATAFMASPMTPDYPMRATCPKCSRDLIYVTTTPHPNALVMRRTTFVCYPCNRTWNFMLSPEMAGAFYAPGDAMIRTLELGLSEHDRADRRGVGPQNG